MVRTEATLMATVTDTATHMDMERTTDPTPSLWFSLQATWQTPLMSLLSKLIT